MRRRHPAAVGSAGWTPRPLRVPDEWEVPDFPPMPLEVAIDVAHFAQWRLAKWVEDEKVEGN